jgi:hypothetical protein
MDRPPQGTARHVPPSSRTPALWRTGCPISPSGSNRTTLPATRERESICLGELEFGLFVHQRRCNRGGNGVYHWFLFGDEKWRIKAASQEEFSQWAGSEVDDKSKDALWPRTTPAGSETEE